MLDLYPLLRPALPLIDAERGHRIALWALRNGLLRPETSPDDPVLTTSLMGRMLPNPIGLAAGFDKNALVINATQSMGFGFIEIGGVTPRPQPGNPRPRLFRLSEDHAVINRMGFNNDGMDIIAQRLTLRDPRAGMVGVNMASNSDSQDPARDFDLLVEKFTPLADYMTIDISCPNTPNGKVFQSKAPLEALLERLKATRARAAQQAGVALPCMLIKSAPDLTEQEKRDIAQVALASGIDGMIVSNTTIARPDSLRSRYRSERGGMSGRPLFEMSTRLLAEMYRLTEGKVTLIGVGGIASAADAYEKIRQGAAAVQLYSAMVFHGPHLVHRMKQELAQLLRRDGFASVGAAVGAAHR
ncbi:MAG: quinone-dependent dihydroorotate dehydrogenase [Reyranellaceae bacterium]